MRIVATTGYGMTGSTAVTDLISEYSGVYTSPFSAYEIRFIFDEHGIIDLFDKLVNSNITDSKELAVRSFKKLCEACASSGTKMNYEVFFNGHFMEYTNDYIAELGGNDYYTVHDFSTMNKAQRLVYRVLNKIYYSYKLMTTRQGYAESKIQPLTVFSKEDRHYLFSVTEQEFLFKTKKYLNRLFSEVSDEKILNIHRLVPMEDIDGCTGYFDDICVVTSERDPRDVFLNARYKRRDLDYPCQDVELFCKYYRWLRTFEPKEDKSRVLHIQFEDLVFKYDETVSKIEEFVGLNPDDHERIRTRFIPELASRNCNLKEKYPAEIENIRIIEDHLSQWLYDFCLD